MENKVIPQNYGSLGKEIKISPKSNVAVFTGTDTQEPYIEVIINIGESHTATLRMTVAAWIKLREGEGIKVLTKKQFKENLL